MAEKRHFNYKGNQLKQLRAFCAAADQESISRAADQLYLSQPSVSQLIKALEAEMGVTLFERHGPKIRLSDEGRALHELALPLVAGLDALPQTLAASREQFETGEISIAAGEATLLNILPPLIRRFRKRYPGTHVRLRNVTGREGTRLLRDDQVDLAVGAMFDIPGDLRYDPIWSYRTVLIAAPDHPLGQKERVSLADISPHGLILPPRRLTTWRMIDVIFRQHGLDYEVALEAGGWEVIKRYVREGLGVAIVASVCLQNDSEGLVVHDLANYFPHRSYGLVTRKTRSMTPQCQRFVGMLRPDSSTLGTR